MGLDYNDSKTKKKKHRRGPRKKVQNKQHVQRADSHGAAQGHSGKKRRRKNKKVDRCV